MIKTLVVTPEFLNSIINNNELVNKLANLTKEYSAPVYSEVIFLIDNLKSENREEYINISRTHGNHNVNIKYIIEDFLLKLRVEKIDIKLDKLLSLNIDYIWDKPSDLQKKFILKLNKFIGLPTTEDKIKKEIKNTVRFTNKIFIFDPYIAQHMTNFSQTGINQIKESIKIIEAKEFPYNKEARDQEYYINPENNKVAKYFKDHDILVDLEGKDLIEEFKIEINENSDDHKISIRKILEFIFCEEPGYYNLKKNFNVIIQSSVKKKDIRSFEKYLYEIKKKIEDENNKEKIKKFQKLYDSVNSQIFIKKHIFKDILKEKLSRCFSNPKWNQHSIDLQVLDEYDENNEQFYRKGIVAYGNTIKAIVCCGKGIDLFKVHTNYVEKKKIETKIKILVTKKHKSNNLKEKEKFNHNIDKVRSELLKIRKNVKIQDNKQFWLELITEPNKQKLYTTHGRVR